MAAVQHHTIDELPEEREPGLQFLQGHFAEASFPWTQVAGYAVSLALTGAALLLVINHWLPASALLAVVLALAVGQALLQLGVFMHLRESRGPAWHAMLLSLSLAIGVGMVICSVWIMTFKWGVS
jgi:cytochrome aa3-600 menaquinol oxidase subunit 4